MTNEYIPYPWFLNSMTIARMADVNATTLSSVLYLNLPLLTPPYRNLVRYYIIVSRKLYLEGEKSL